MSTTYVYSVAQDAVSVVSYYRVVCELVAPTTFTFNYHLQLHFFEQRPIDWKKVRRSSQCQRSPVAYDHTLLFNKVLTSAWLLFRNATHKAVTERQLSR